MGGSIFFKYFQIGVKYALIVYLMFNFVYYIHEGWIQWGVLSQKVKDEVKTLQHCNYYVIGKDSSLALRSMCDVAEREHSVWFVLRWFKLLVSKMSDDMIYFVNWLSGTYGVFVVGATVIYLVLTYVGRNQPIMNFSLPSKSSLHKIPNVD